MNYAPEQSFVEINHDHYQVNDNKHDILIINK